MNKFLAIQSAIDNFDFELVHKVMTYLDWVWLSKRDGEFVEEVPTISELKATAMEYLSECYDYSKEHNTDWVVASGGLCVESFVIDNSIKLIMSFNLDTWEEIVKI